MVAGLSGGDFGAGTSVDAGVGGGACGVGGVSTGVVTGSGLGEHAASSATPTNGTSSMKWRRFEKFFMVGTFGEYSRVVGGWEIAFACTASLKCEAGMLFFTA